MNDKNPEASSPRKRKAAPFRDVDVAHTIVRAAEQVGFDLSDPEAFLRRLQHVEYGLSAEIEFAAILRWLGRCPLVHRLSDDAFSNKPDVPWEIPDLLAVFEADGQMLATLIEVKTTSDNELLFTRRYLEKLQAYAKLVGRPLLVAWRPRQIGFWMLFDPQCAEPQDHEKLRVDRSRNRGDIPDGRAKIAGQAPEQQFADLARAPNGACPA